MQNSKRLPREEISKKCQQLKAQNHQIVLCHGCFDLLHIGHLRHFKAAKSFGDILIVSLTADKFISKGTFQPIFSQELRMEFVASLECVDYVAFSNNPSAVEEIRLIKPHFFAKGSDYKIRNEHTNPNIYLEEQAVAEMGGKLVYTDDLTFSSTNLLEIITERLKKGIPIGCNI